MKAFLLKNLKSIFIVSFILILTSGLVYAFSSGIVGRTIWSSTPGCTCHGPNPTTSVLVEILGPDSVAINQTVTYTIRITGGPLVRAGTNIAVERGTLDTADALLQNMSGELTHLAPIAPSGGFVTAQFKYTAPATTGKDTIYANGNSVNFNNANTGDSWNFAPNRIIDIVPSIGIKNISSIATDYSLMQNYPNPFNPTTKITFNVAKSGNVKIIVTDMLGKKLTTLVDQNLNNGSYEVEFDGKEFSSGIYFYKMVMDEFADVKKMLLIK